jgi:hypothetical protein
MLYCEMLRLRRWSRTPRAGDCREAGGRQFGQSESRRLALGLCAVLRVWARHLMHAPGQAERSWRVGACGCRWHGVGWRRWREGVVRAAHTRAPPSADQRRPGAQAQRGDNVASPKSFDPGAPLRALGPRRFNQRSLVPVSLQPTRAPRNNKPYHVSASDLPREKYVSNTRHGRDGARLQGFCCTVQHLRQS